MSDAKSASLADEFSISYLLSQIKVLTIESLFCGYYALVLTR